MNPTPTPAGATPTVRIAIISGVCVDHDAISNSMRDQAAALEALGHHVELFAQHADGQRTDDVTIVRDSYQLVNHPGYASAALAVFHFGVNYDLFNALLLPGGPERVVHFHNVTPPDLLSGAARAVSESSLRQLSIADLAAECWVDSWHNREVLHEYTSVPVDRVYPMELLIPDVDDPRPVLDAPEGEPLVILTVGRMVEAKGLLDLVRALKHLPDDVGPVSLVIAGSRTFSSAAFLEQLQDALVHLPSHVSTAILESPDDELLRRNYLDAHLFVSASWHEGFCVPVIEALALGCRVVTTDAGALPDTVGACGEVVATHDPAALGEAVLRAARAARGSEHCVATDDDTRQAHLRQFGSDDYRGRLLAAVARLTGTPEVPVSDQDSRA